MKHLSKFSVLILLFSLISFGCSENEEKPVKPPVSELNKPVKASAMWNSNQSVLLSLTTLGFYAPDSTNLEYLLWQKSDVPKCHVYLQAHPEIGDLYHITYETDSGTFTMYKGFIPNDAAFSVLFSNFYFEPF